MHPLSCFVRGVEIVTECLSDSLCDARHSREFVRLVRQLTFGEGRNNPVPVVDQLCMILHISRPEDRYVARLEQSVNERFLVKLDGSQPRALTPMRRTTLPMKLVCSEEHHTPGEQTFLQGPGPGSELP
jgi:hypothetical protein